MITREQFELACGSSIRSTQITDEMLAIVSRIPRPDAKRLIDMPSIGWDSESVIAEIEEACGPRCKDRHVSAVLNVAVIYGA